MDIIYVHVVQFENLLSGTTLFPSLLDLPQYCINRTGKYFNEPKVIKFLLIQPQPDERDCVVMVCDNAVQSEMKFMMLLYHCGFYSSFSIFIFQIYSAEHVSCILRHLTELSMEHFSLV